MTVVESEKIDLKKTLKEFYAPSAKAPALVTVPPLHVLCVEGSGDPNTSPGFSQAVEALYSTSYTLKFMLKKRAQTPDYTVMPLEGLWWADDMGSFALGNRNEWLWRALIVQPDFVTAADVEEAKTQAAAKKSLPALDSLRFEVFDEGLAAQIMHIGPYAAEAPTIQRLHDFIAEQGLVRSGRHHEIYMSDPGRTAPEKMKTIVRQPAARA